MANLSTHNPSEPLPTQPSHWSWSLTLLGSLLGILLFVGLMLLAYVNHGPKRPDRSLVEERLRKVAEVKAKQQSLIQSYEWVDEAEGIVRIPITRAMELVVQDQYKQAIGIDVQPPNS